MKLVSHFKNGKELLAVMVGDELYDATVLYHEAPVTMQDMLRQWNTHYPRLLNEVELIRQGEKKYVVPMPLSAAEIVAPVPHPTSCRDGYAFRQHVAAARRNRNVPMIPEFDQYPIFYFTNHNSIQGPGDIYCMPDHFEKLDFELEVAIVICKEGRNIRAENAGEFIGGFMIMNDMSARRLQMEEMLLSLGPAKGKDFSTVIGPYLVTPDELQDSIAPPMHGHKGNSYNLSMKCRVNGELVSQGNMADMNWTFAEIIERVSYGVTIYPGDIIGSGTVGTGCFLELNGTARLNNPLFKEQWLQAGDLVEMEIEGLGTLKNCIRKEVSDFSLLAEKKNVETYG